MLYAHGMMDPRIDISETETMVKALRKNGVAATFIRFPDEGHGWRKLKNRLFYYRQEAAFLEKNLLPDAAK
jgi:dipeptidyl aminopeptidase/acylaminoacyl peptidase